MRDLKKKRLELETEKFKEEKRNNLEKLEHKYEDQVIKKQKLGLEREKMNYAMQKY